MKRWHASINQHERRPPGPVVFSTRERGGGGEREIQRERGIKRETERKEETDREKERDLDI